MKALACFLLALTVLAPVRGDILANSDFSDGKAHWQGDVQDASSSDSANLSGSSGGASLQLKSDSWTSISQTFDTSEKKLNFSMTYTTSPDFKLEDFIKDGFFQALGGFLGVKLRRSSLQADHSSAIVVIADLEQGMVDYAPIVLQTSPNSTTVTAGFDGLLEHEEKTIYIIFPHGTGTISFSNISLTKPEAPQGTPDSPLQN